MKPYALTPAQAAVAILPPHTPGRHEQPAVLPIRTAGEFMAGETLADEPLLELHTQTCKSCSRKFVARFPGFCDDCFEKEVERVQVRNTTAVALKTFPERARQVTQKMRGPSLEKAKAIMPLLRSNQGAQLIVIGDRWTGKTVMATWWAQMLGFGLYTKAYDLFASVRRTYHEDSKLREHEVLDRFRKADFLVIDEAQERKESDWENTLLTNLIDKRYDALKPTVIIANLKQDALDAALGPSIVRRVAETGGIIECTWPPYGQ